MDDREQFFGEVSLWVVLGPFVLAFCFIGATLAALSGRFLFEVLVSGGRLPPASSPEIPTADR